MSSSSHDESSSDECNVDSGEDFFYNTTLKRKLVEASLKSGRRRTPRKQQVQEEEQQHDDDDDDETDSPILRQNTMNVSLEEIHAFEARENRPPIQIVEMKPKGKEDICLICQTEGSMECNRIMYCNGCDMLVHQDCYGVETIPQGEWLCRGCIKGLKEGSRSRSGKIRSSTEELFACDENEVDDELYNPDFAMICTFFHRFGVSGLKLACIKIDELVHALQFPNETSYMGDLFTELLSKFDKPPFQEEDNCQMQLFKLLEKWNVNGVFFQGETNGYNPLENTEFADLSLQSRILLLRLVCDWLFAKNINLSYYLRKIFKEDESRWRDTALGTDHTGRDYWLMEDSHSFWISRCQKYDKSEWELVCKNMEDFDKLIASCGESTHAVELQLFVALRDRIKPYFIRKVTSRELVQRKLNVCVNEIWEFHAEMEGMQPYLGCIENVNRRGKRILLKVRWFYRQQDLNKEGDIQLKTNEQLFSTHIDEVEIASLKQKVDLSEYICDKVYDCTAGCLDTSEQACEELRKFKARQSGLPLIPLKVTELSIVQSQELVQKKLNVRKHDLWEFHPEMEGMQPYLGCIENVNRQGERIVLKVRWFYRQQDLNKEGDIQLKSNEQLFSTHIDEVDIATLKQKVELSEYICERVYDCAAGCLDTSEQACEELRKFKAKQQMRSATSKLCFGAKNQKPVAKKSVYYLAYGSQRQSLGASYLENIENSSPSQPEVGVVCKDADSTVDGLPSDPSAPRSAFSINHILSSSVEEPLFSHPVLPACVSPLSINHILSSPVEEPLSSKNCQHVFP